MQHMTPLDGVAIDVPITYTPRTKDQLALLIPGHNEELVIQDTINSALAAGQALEHIYVVNDASTDATAKLARAIVGHNNVLTVRRSGKALAIRKALNAFRIVDRYEWVHIADADSVFDKNYFKEFLKHLDASRYVAMTGYVQALNGGLVSKFRAYDYTYGQEVMRRLQHALGVISVIPGPSSCYRTDILKELDFETNTMTEDFDITLQIHRKKLGRIGFIPTAKTLTQDPRTIRDYYQQVERWYRGFWQGVTGRKIGRRFQRLDVYMSYQIIEAFVYALNFLIFLPVHIYRRTSPIGLAVTFLLDVGITLVWCIVAAVKHKSWGVIAAFPMIYFFRMINLLVYLKSFVEIVVLRKFRTHQVGWATEGRRYKITQGVSS